MAADSSAETPARAAWLGRAGIAVLAAIAVGLALDAFLHLKPGPLSIDEITYHLMAKNAAAGRLFIENGWHELPSTELQTLQIRATAGGLSAQYPQGYAFLAAPFYALFGYAGLYLLNALAFCGAALACQRLSFHFFRDARWAALATALWAFATYAWEYALAVWPHSVATAAILATIWLCATGLELAGAAARKRLIGAGIACGLGATVRLDVMLCALAAFAPLLARRRLRELEPALWFALGLLPGMALLSLVNLSKWGTPFPLSYGSAAHLAVIPWGLGLLVLLALVAIQQRDRLVAALGVRGLAGLGALALLALLLFPGTRRVLFTGGSGLFALTVDAAALPVDPSELAIERTESGAVVYFGGLKKAVLQSCPYFSVGIAGLVLLFRAEDRARRIWLLVGTPLTYALFYGASAWHGGLCFNMRYLLPVLPFAAIASALALRALSPNPRALGLALLPGLIVSAGLGFTVWPLDAPLPRLEGPLLAFPLLVTGLLGVLTLLWLLWPGVWLGRFTAALAGLGVGWAALVGFDYDAAHSRSIRAWNASIAQDFARHVSDDSLFFAQHPDSAYLLADLRQNVRIALPSRDGFKDFRKLLSFHARAGRRVFAAFTPPLWRALDDGGRLDGLQMRVAGRVANFELRELIETERAARYSPSLSR